MAEMYRPIGNRTLPQVQSAPVGVDYSWALVALLLGGLGGCTIYVVIGYSLGSGPNWNLLAGLIGLIGLGLFLVKWAERRKNTKSK